jgi:hypothetical protein
VLHAANGTKIHYLANRRPVPACAAGGEALSPAWWEVTCQRCMRSLPLAMAQFAYAWKLLAVALWDDLRGKSPYRIRTR